MRIRILVSQWPQTEWAPRQSKFVPYYWRSLDALQNIELRVISYPAKRDIPFSFVSHAKYATRDGREAWISTSNITPDYFLTTVGIALTL